MGFGFMAERPLDKRIRFEERSRTIDPVWKTVSGESWGEVCAVWASVWEVLPARAERMGESIDVSRRLFDIEVRYGAPINAEMRVRYGELAMKIVSGPTEKGRKHRLVLRCEVVSTEGVEP